jgi:hypothetical protein
MEMLKTSDPSDSLLNKWHMETYEKQRRDRLGDVIGDYLTDEDTTAVQFFIELKQEIQEWVDYHQKFLRKAQDVQALVNGHNPISDFTLGDK